MRCPSCHSNLDVFGARFCPACGAATDPAADPMIGQVVGGRYTIQYLVAEGGMGRVYAAEQSMGGRRRRVAIKVLLTEYAMQDNDLARLARECATVAELEHPNTIKFYDFGETKEGDLYIAMEFLTGDSLAQALKDGQHMPPERVDMIVGQICGSLQEAHDHGIIHRDLKPDNIILTSPGGTADFVKVLDFGIAKRVNRADPKLTPLGVVLGSPPYMSPEQFTLQEIDARSDIYSLGVVAYQMLTGTLPFTANDNLEWAALHMGVAPIPVDAHNIPIPPSMRVAVMRSLAKDPRSRPQTMREFYSEFTIGAGTGRGSSGFSLTPSLAPMSPAVRPSSISAPIATPSAPPVPLHAPAPVIPDYRASSPVPIAPVAGAIRSSASPTASASVVTPPPVTGQYRANFPAPLDDPSPETIRDPISAEQSFVVESGRSAADSLPWPLDAKAPAAKKDGAKAPPKKGFGETLPLKTEKGTLVIRPDSPGGNPIAEIVRQLEASKAEPRPASAPPHGPSAPPRGSSAPPRMSPAAPLPVSSPPVALSPPIPPPTIPRAPIAPVADDVSWAEPVAAFPPPQPTALPIAGPPLPIVRERPPPTIRDPKALRAAGRRGKRLGLFIALGVVMLLGAAAAYFFVFLRRV
ncbi:MAG: protein kinase [Polyangiaceae bacterium]